MTNTDTMKGWQLPLGLLLGVTLGYTVARADPRPYQVGFEAGRADCERAYQEGFEAGVEKAAKWISQ